MTVNKITNAPTQNKIINTVNDLIDNKQDTLIAGTDLEIIPAQAPILPEGFTQIEYIEGTGTQYIDTGFYGTQNSGVYIKYALTDLTSNGSARVFGTRNGTLGTGAFAFITSKDGTSLPNDNFYIASNGSASQSTNIDANWHEVSCNIENDKKVYFDGNLIFTGSNTAYTSTAQASIFRTYNRTAYGAVATAKISILQIYENAVMVHNFIPCRRDSDDELGMYDLVSDTFFTNSGTGTFIAGPDVIFPETDLINFTNASGYITGITSSDVTTALGYTPYDSANPAGYTTNVGTVTSVNNTQPDANGDVALTIPTVNDGVLTITQNGTSKGTFSANQSTNNTIALTDTTYNAFTGADGTNAGSSGLVPAPSATDNDKYLKGDGTWASVSASSGANTDLSNLSATGEAHFLKSINSTDVINALGYTPENQANKVTSFSSSSTDTQYPSAKLLYDQLLLKQNTSTAVTHTANWAVGNSTTPVYINSSGVAISTTLSIASSRFDGQWVAKYESHSWTAKGSYTISLSSYLPSDRTSYSYYIYVVAAAARGSSNGNFRVGTVANPSTNMTTAGNYSIGGYVTSNSTGWYGSAIIPVAPSGSLYSELTVAMNNTYCYLMGYRRIGTNS